MKAAGWGVVEGSRIRREYVITLGRIESHGRRGKGLKADYVLEYRNTKLAVLEAKARDEALTEGVAQAKDYATKLDIRFCHRGGANDESSWRDILTYFTPAVQLGLTATPKRKDNVDTYRYFGEPVFIYSLKDGINDGFLTPFKVKQITTTLDEYIYTPDDYVVEGDIEEGKRYVEADFNRLILDLKYDRSLEDAVEDLGKPDEIGRVFVGFQKFLYVGNTAHSRI